MIDVNTLVRDNVKALKPYTSARDDFNGEALVWLDANENPNDTYFNRYPDPKQEELKQVLSVQKNVSPKQIFIGNGSDEIIDLLFRAFCEPKQDKAYVFNPTYGMYKVSAQINQVELVNLKLGDAFQWPSFKSIQDQIKTKGLMFICSPNNPTGNSCSLSDIKNMADQFNGLLVVDEAYIDFSDSPSAITLIESTPNLVVVQTFSKALGLAGLRLGMTFANPIIINVLNKIKPPYNVNTYSQSIGKETILNQDRIKEDIRRIQKEKARLVIELEQLDGIEKVYPSDANFLLVECRNAESVYHFLKTHGIIVRNRASEINKCIRISVGTPKQNDQLLNVLKKM